MTSQSRLHEYLTETSNGQITAEFVVRDEDLGGYFKCEKLATSVLTEKGWRQAWLAQGFFLLFGGACGLGLFYSDGLLKPGAIYHASPRLLLLDILLPLIVCSLLPIIYCVALQMAVKLARGIIMSSSPDDLNAKYSCDNVGFEWNALGVRGKFRWSEVNRIDCGFGVISFDCFMRETNNKRSRINVFLPVRLFRSETEMRDLSNCLRSQYVRATRSYSTSPVVPLLKPPNEIATVAFSPPTDQLTVVPKYQWDSGRTKLSRIRDSIVFLLWICGGNLIFVILGSKTGHLDWEKWIGQVIPQLTTALFGQWISGNKTGSHSGKLTYYWGSYDFAFGKDDFVLSDIDGSVQYQWSRVQSIGLSRDKDNIIIDFKIGDGIVIPTATFKTDEETVYFMQILRTFSQTGSPDSWLDPNQIKWPPITALPKAIDPKTLYPSMQIS